MRHFRLESILLYLHRISVFTQNLGQTLLKGFFLLLNSPANMNLSFLYFFSAKVLYFDFKHLNGPSR